MPLLDRRQLLHTGLAASLAGPLVAASPHSAPSGAGKPPFQLGLVTYNVAAAWDLPVLLKVCSQAGISPVEFRTTHRHGVEPALDRDQRRDVRRRCADAGIGIWACGTICEFQAPEPAVVRRNIETCKQFVALAADLGARGVKVRPNGLPAGVPVEKTLEQIATALRSCGRAAADAGVEIFLEVHGAGTDQPRHVHTIMKQCAHDSVGLTWNSNPSDVHQGSVAESFELLWPWIRSCHINSLYQDSTGAYPYRQLFSLLRGKGYDRVTLCEVGQVFPDPAQGAEFLRTYKALWTELCRP